MNRSWHLAQRDGTRNRTTLSLRTFCVVLCLAACAGCSSKPNRCASGYHEQGTLCMPNWR